MKHFSQDPFLEEEFEDCYFCQHIASYTSINGEISVCENCLEDSEWLAEQIIEGYKYKTKSNKKGGGD